LQNDTDLKHLQDLARIVNQADTAFNANQFDLAIKHYKAASDGYVQHFSQNNPERLQCLKQLAESYWQLQADQQAETVWSEVCGLLVTIDPFPAEKYVVSMFKLVKSLERQGKVPETEETYELLVTEAERLLNSSHPLQLSIRKSQASFLRHLDKLDQAKAVEDHIVAFQNAVAEKVSEPAAATTPAPRDTKGLRTTVVLNKSRKGHSSALSPHRIMMFLFFMIVLAIVGWMLVHVFNMKLPHKF